MKKHWIFLSPHLDDAVYSCGGLIWEQVQKGDPVEVWTIFAGDPPDDVLSPFAQGLHQRWQTGMDASVVRREEDWNACSTVGASAYHFNFLDCIYRRFPGTGEPLIRRDEDLFTPIVPEEQYLVNQLVEQFFQMVPENIQLVSPLGLGGHMDHRLVRKAAETMGMPLWYYADYPYAGSGEWMETSALESFEKVAFKVSRNGLMQWQKAASAYQSQLNTFWKGEAELEAALEIYWQKSGGRFLWRRR